MQAFKKQLVQAAREVYERRLVTAQVGNLSLKEKDKVLISATGTSLGYLTEKDVVVINLAGEIIEGTQEPSAEKLMHLAIYQARHDITAIVHTHSPYASAFGCLKKDLEPVNPESEYLLGKVSIVPHFVPNTKELAEAVARHLADSNVCLLERHGVVSVGKDMREAANLAELVEEAAKINYIIQTLEG